MAKVILNFLVNAFKQDGYLNEVWTGSRILRAGTLIGTGVLVLVAAAAPALLADWYKQSIYSLSLPGSWLWGAWPLLIFSAVLLHMSETIQTYHRCYAVRFQQSIWITKSRQGDEVFAEIMAEGDVQKRLSRGAPEIRLVRAVFEAFFAGVMSGLFFSAIALLPAAILTAFVPNAFIPAVAFTFTAVAIVYMCLGILTTTAQSLYYMLLNIPLFIIFFNSGLLAVVVTQIAIGLTAAITSYATKKVIWAKYSSQ